MIFCQLLLKKLFASISLRQNFDKQQWPKNERKRKKKEQKPGEIHLFYISIPNFKAIFKSKA